MQPQVAKNQKHAMAHYNALVAKADEVGWPLRFRTDLTKHDREFLKTKPIDRPFSWILREDGTSLYFPGLIDGVGHRASDGARMNAESSGADKCKFFIWDGRALIEFATAEQADARMAEIEERLGVRWTRNTQEINAQ
jgi:hypothetical protein